MRIHCKRGAVDLAATPFLTSVHILVNEARYWGHLFRASAMHFCSWSLGLKTGIYYLRTQAKAKAQQFTIDPSKKQVEEECLMCGS